MTYSKSAVISNESRQLASARWLLTVDGHSGTEILLEPSCLDTEGINVETDTETGGDITYASVLAIVVADA